MEITREIINKQIDACNNQLKNKKNFRDIETKNRNCEYNRKYYLNNRKKIIKKKMKYNKTNKNFKENTRIFSRLNYNYKNGYF